MGGGGDGGEGGEIPDTGGHAWLKLEMQDHLVPINHALYRYTDDTSMDHSVHPVNKK